MTTSMPGHFADERARGALHGRLGVPRGGAFRVLVRGQAEQQHARDAFAARRGRFRTASSTERLNTPGIEEISRRTPSPSQTKSG